MGSCIQTEADVETLSKVAVSDATPLILITLHFEILSVKKLTGSFCLSFRKGIGILDSRKACLLAS